ncbi:restriction endonuclease [Streptomyces sp. NPDC020681]|uniref:restriction endonuclease n=1 Tax=Streptomyces sp. NPDC020681 TaxID=3365083 RepID=UPI0037BC470F
MSAPARRRTSDPAPLGLPGCAFTAAVHVFGIVALLMWADGLRGGAVFFVLLIVASGIARGVAKAKRSAETRRVRAIQSTEVVRYHAMNPRQFEEAIAFLCERDGCRDARVVGGANDLGADVIATAPDGRRIVIQCKRYGPTTKVGSPDLQRFGGTCFSVHGAQVAAVVTTSVFTRPAANYAAQHGILVFDEQGLAAWATHTGPAPWM